MCNNAKQDMSTVLIATSQLDLAYLYMFIL